MDDRPQDSDLATADHAVVAALADLDAARVVIEDLEEHGVPPEAIALIGTHPDGPEPPPGKEGSTESQAFTDVTKSAIAGGAGGAVVGGVLGSLVTLAIPGVGLVVAAGLGAIYGAGVGGAAGGMSVAKYNSPAWTETFETIERGQVAVGVHHADATVVDAAQEVIGRHTVSKMARFDDGRRTEDEHG